MWETLKEHAQEFAADTLIKRLLPSLLAGWLTSLSGRLRWVDTGRPLLSEKSVQALVGLAILLTHYVMHLWFYLKRRDEVAKAALPGKEDTSNGKS